MKFQIKYKNRNYKFTGLKKPVNGRRASKKEFFRAKKIGLFYGSWEEWVNLRQQERPASLFIKDAEFFSEEVNRQYLNIL